jgi:major membrane immunogen (membrane-anchored lipoprotein)
VIKKFLTIISILSLSILAASCSSSDNGAATNANTSTETNTATTAGPDNSDITTTNENGVRTETRTFRDNPRVSKVVVTTRDGKTTAKAYSPSGDERELSQPEKALNATGEAIADSAGWVKDKGSDVVDKSKDVTKDAVDKTKDVSKTVGERTVP